MKLFESPITTQQAHTYASIVADTADSKGFDRPTWENFVGKVAMSITEVNEARMGAIGEEGEFNLDEELADIVIRLFDVLHRLGDGEWCLRSGSMIEEHAYCSPEELLWPIIGHHCKAIEHWRHDRRGDALICLELAVKACFQVAARCNFDLVAAIEAKMEKNAARPQRNGKAQSLG